MLAELLHETFSWPEEALVSEPDTPELAQAPPGAPKRRCVVTVGHMHCSCSEAVFRMLGTIHYLSYLTASYSKLSWLPSARHQQ